MVMEHSGNIWHGENKMRVIERARIILNTAPADAMQDAAGLVGLAAAFFCGFLVIATI